MFVVPLSANIRAQRENKGITQHQLSCIAGLPGNAVFRMENGNSKKTSNLRAQAIANALGCPIEELFEMPNIANDAHREKANT